MKARIVKITPEFISMLCKSTEGKICIEIDGIPEDSKFLWAYFDNGQGTFNGIFEHDSFDNIESGNQFPEQIIKYTKYYD